MDTDDLKLIRHISAAQSNRLVFNWEERCGPSSEIWTYKSRVIRNHPNEYIRWCQVACTGKHVWIDNSESDKHILKIVSWV